MSSIQSVHSTRLANPAHSAHAVRALVALGVGGFAIGTGEFVIMGLLPEVARDVGITIPAAGHFISAYALGVVIGAPLLAVLCARWPRRALLIALMALYALANFATVLAPGYLAIGMARFASGLPHGTYFGVAALVAAGIAPPNQRARAVGFVMLGLTTALLTGVPLGAWLGQYFGWRAAFVLVGVVATLATVLIRYCVPDLPADADGHPLRELGALLRPQVWLTLGIAGIGFGGMFCVFSYIKPALVEVSGLSVTHVPLVLSLFGFGGIAGNLIGARLADRALMRTIGGTLIYSAVLLAGFGMLAQHLPTAMLGVFLLGSIVALGPAVQIRLMDVAGDAQTLAAALNHSAFNFANALGAWLGGRVIAAGLGWGALGWGGALLAIGGLVMLGISLALQRTSKMQ
jgi:DHA1 family inner membrane transport protein